MPARGPSAIPSGRMWMAWVPGLRFYALGSSIDAVSDGIGFAFVEIVFLLFRLLPTPQNNKTVTMIIMLVIFASLITYLVFTIRMFLRITVVFRTSKWWLVPAILADWIPLLFLGFNPKYQPQKVSFSNEEIKAGTKPADISGTGSRSEMPAAIDSGLSIRLKERTIKRLTGKKRYLLRDIAMDVPNGSMVLLLGGSGAGKTTFVNAVIGYEKAAKTAQKAHREGISLKEACVSLGFLTEKEFDECYHPERMV